MANISRCPPVQRTAPLSRKVSACASFALWAVTSSWKKKAESPKHNPGTKDELMNSTPLLAELADLIKGWSIPFLIVMVAVAFVIIFRAMASRYKKIPPNSVGIFYGRKYKWLD